MQFSEQAEKYCCIKQPLKPQTKGSDHFSIQYECLFSNHYIGGEPGSSVTSCPNPSVISYEDTKKSAFKKTLCISLQETQSDSRRCK